MENRSNVEIIRDFTERAFNQGDLTVIDEHLSSTGVDHQEPLGTDFIAHLKQVVMGLRTAFPDLQFDIQHILGEGEIVAFHSIMTGTHLGVLKLGPGPGVPPTGRAISVPHMHFVRLVDGKGYDLWHLWDTPAMMRQLGVVPERQTVPA